MAVSFFPLTPKVNILTTLESSCLQEEDVCGICLFPDPYTYNLEQKILLKKISVDTCLKIVFEDFSTSNVG